MAVPSVWVSGEISNLAQPRSGHIYLTLKDEDAQIRAVLWKGSASRLTFDLEDGQDVLCLGGLDVYPPRGSYQLVIREVEPRGVGGLQLALRKLQAKLAAEGLFDPDRKRPLPRFPRRIAFVTSPTGAAIRDFLEVLRRRYPNIEVLVIPAKVQGDQAPREIVAGIRQANQLREPPDVLVVGRGGGSMEDLWCFNDEQVVRAIAASRIPTVSAVGHEIDVTLSDLVADVRALTPSEAAELVVPSSVELTERMASIRQRLGRGLHGTLRQARLQLARYAEHRVFRRPFDKIHERQRLLDDIEAQATRAVRNRMNVAQGKISQAAAQLEALSPLKVLARGYSVTRNERAEVIHQASQLTAGDVVETILAQGRFRSRVESLDIDDQGEQAGSDS